jgi:hypothetical protein
MGESHIDENVLKQSWDTLDQCWRKLDALRSQYAHGQVTSEDADRFVSGWQLFIFEARELTPPPILWHIVLIARQIISSVRR